MKNGLGLVPNPLATPSSPPHVLSRGFCFYGVCETPAFGSATILNYSTHLKNALYKDPEIAKLPFFVVVVVVS
jgi:hypothetical protein